MSNVSIFLWFMCSLNYDILTTPTKNVMSLIPQFNTGLKIMYMTVLQYVILVLFAHCIMNTEYWDTVTYTDILDTLWIEKINVFRQVSNTPPSSVGWKTVCSMSLDNTGPLCFHFSGDMNKKMAYSLHILTSQKITR